MAESRVAMRRRTDKRKQGTMSLADPSEVTPAVMSTDSSKCRSRSISGLAGGTSSKGEGAKISQRIDVAERAVISVQRRWRAGRTAFRELGPSFFFSRTASASFGNIRFKRTFAARSHHSFMKGDAAVSPYVVISDSTKVGRFCWFLERYWGLQRPDLIVSVTGSAGSMHLSWSNAQFVADCIANLAQTARCWFISGGTDSGIMQLVGDCMWMRSVNQPLIGIVPFGAVKGARTLKGNAGRTVPAHTGSRASSSRRVNSSSADEGVALNGWHTHFIMVDNGKSGVEAFGGEIEFRGQLEMFYFNERRVPVVQLAVQGGPGTLGTIAGETFPRLMRTDALRICVVHCDDQRARCALQRFLPSPL